MRRWLAFVLSLVLLLPAPLWAAWVADGNDHIDAANNAVTGIDVSDFSWSCWVNFPTEPSGGNEYQVITHAALIAGGNLRQNFAIDDAGGGSIVLKYYHGFSGNGFANWIVAGAVVDLQANTWYHIGVDYDSAAANDPVLVINGVARTTTEVSAPSGTRLTGTDSLRIGEDLGGGTDFIGSIAECGFWNRRLTSGEWSNLGVDKWAPSKIPSGLVYYIPLITDATETQGATGTLTVTGGSFGTHVPGMVYPSSGRRAVAPMLLP